MKKSPPPIKAQLNVRLIPVVVELIKLERASIPGCASDGEALEAIVLRSATTPEARRLILAAAMQYPLFAAAHRAWEDAT